MTGFSHSPRIMAIINATPDSFSDGGKHKNLNDAVNWALQLAEEGADILDIGGESSRPFSEPVRVDEELSRVIPLIKSIRQKTNLPISIDTTKAEVAKEAIFAGANMINDISALRFDPIMAETVAQHQLPVVIMHMLGTPKTMQKSPYYEDVILDILNFFDERVSFALSQGIDKHNILLDPGIGFGKTTEHNLKILNHLDQFKKTGFPLLIGLSRKAFLGTITGEKEPSNRDIETLCANIWAIMKGADILRVHNVRQCKKAIQIIDAIKKEMVTDGSA